MERDCLSEASIVFTRIEKKPLLYRLHIFISALIKGKSLFRISLNINSKLKLNSL